MIQEYPHDFDPFSKESLNAVEMIEFLPDSIAFEHVMYDNRLSRVSTYEYNHNEETGSLEDLEPLVINPALMVTQFPQALKDAFPEVEYTIEQLKIEQTETKKDHVLALSFYANSRPHLAVIQDGVSYYETVNEDNEPVMYAIEPEAIIGLIASFLYAKQYDPEKSSQNAIELVESNMFMPRDPKIDLLERIIMSLGDHSGYAGTQTTSVFDNPFDTPIIATLVNIEFPDKSASMNKLVIDEVEDIKDMTTSVETTLYQSIMNIEQKSSLLETGKIDHQYAEQRSMVLSSLSLPTSEFISSRENYNRWVLTCTAFMNLIKIPMSVYYELDQ